MGSQKIVPGINPRARREPWIFEIMMSMILVLTPIILLVFHRTQKEHRTPWRQWATDL